MWRDSPSRNRNARTPAVARVMSGFYRRRLPNSPEDVARRYVSHLFDPITVKLHRRRWRIAKSSYSVLLATDEPHYDLARLTRSAALVADTLLLTHGAEMPYREAGRFTRTRIGLDPGSNSSGPEAIDLTVMDTYTYGFAGPPLKEIGRFLTGSEPLARSGNLCYLPRYSSTMIAYESRDRTGSTTHGPDLPRTARYAPDFLLRDRRAVSESTATPQRSRFVRLVTEVRLPVIAGVSLATFSRITVEEFGGHRLLRGHVQDRIAELDGAMAADEADRGILRIGREIEAGIGEARSRIAGADRSGALPRSAVLTSVTAALFAVHAPMMRDALHALGLGAGADCFWTYFRHWPENGPRASEDDTWCYMWVLSPTAERA
ncbi:hypothetical protein ACIRJR_20360 [Streptomyces sp. NPDC102402]|uniref:hypothetical protein n=1 Tax=Streptomyces sp. NPDC102402 TaxID=3366169 RepID=UPI003803BF7A